MGRARRVKRECLPQHRHEGKVGHTAEEGARGVHARRPRRQSVEHVECVAVPDLDSIFGPVLLRTGLWAFKQSCSSSNALQT